MLTQTLVGKHGNVQLHRMRGINIRECRQESHAINFRLELNLRTYSVQGMLSSLQLAILPSKVEKRFRIGSRISIIRSRCLAKVQQLMSNRLLIYQIAGVMH